MVEYQSVRTRAQPEQIRAAEALYAALRDGRGARALRCTMGLRERVALLAAGAGALGVALGSLLGSAPVIATVAGLATGAAAAALAAFTLAPLSRLARQARRVGHNPVSQLIYTGRKDEIGEIAFAMKMLETGVAQLADGMLELVQQFWARRRA